MMDMNSYRNYTGQAVIFTITMSDGTQMEVMEYNPFIVINGLGYKTKYEPCEERNYSLNLCFAHSYILKQFSLKSSKLSQKCSKNKIMHGFIKYKLKLITVHGPCNATYPVSDTIC